MALSGDEMKWFGEKFAEVKESVVTAVQEHEARFHSPGHALKTVGALVAIGVGGVTVLAAMLAGLLWLIQHSA